MSEQSTYRRVALFQAEWHLQVHTTNCAITLAERGYQVDLFLFKARDSRVYFELEQLRKWDNIRVHDLSSDTFRGNRAVDNSRIKPWARLKARLVALPPRFVSACLLTRSALYRLLHATLYVFRSEAGILNSSIVAQALERMTGYNYNCLIGIEKKGLIWAARVAEQIKVPFIYHSLELHVGDFSRLVMKRSLYFKRLRFAECKYHNDASATIVQSSDRAHVLFRENGVPLSTATVLYLPVSVRGRVRREKSKNLRERLGIPVNNKVILYFGMLSKARQSLELTQVAQAFPEEWTLVMHGFAEDSRILNEITAHDKKKRVSLSLEMVQSDQVTDIIASADIGLSLYSNLLYNDFLSAFSSEKMALYMQCGVPFVAFDYPGYRFLAEKEKCGAVIRRLGDLVEGISAVLDSYQDFRENAFSAFSKYYDYEKNFSRIMDWLGHLSTREFQETVGG